MRNIKLVFSFTFKEAVRKKSFIVTTIVLCVLIVALSFVPKIISLVSGTDSPDTPADTSNITKENKVYFIDTDNVMPSALRTLTEVMPEIEFIQGDINDIEAYKADMKENTKNYIVEVENKKPMPSLKFYVKSIVSSPNTEGITKILRQQYLSEKLTEGDVPKEFIDLSLSEFSTDTVSIEENGGFMGTMLGTIVLIIMFLAIYYYGYGVAGSVASEKSSRVMETLVVSTKPSNILLGKTFAMGAVGLLQIGLFLVAAFLSVTFILPNGAASLGVNLDFSSFNISSILLVIVYFILGYYLYAMLNAVAGATVSKTEDLQPAMMPVALISGVSYYVALINMTTSNQLMSKITAYVPFISPFRMAYRVMNESIPTHELLISLGILILSVFLVAFFAIRLYSASVLHYGDRIKLKSLIKMAK